jgi:hypothetical protein
VQATDLTELTMRLTQLSEALNGKAPTPGAMKVWHDTLRETPFADVLSVLTDWPKSHAKPPSPADILRVCNERISDRLEREAKDRARDARVLWSPSNLRGDPTSENYRQFKRDLSALSRTPKPHPRAWATRLRDSQHPLTPAQAWALQEYGRKYDFVSSNVDASDDEARAEREAIQAEGSCETRAHLPLSTHQPR